MDTIDNNVFFATAAKGIEEVLADELRGLGIQVDAVETGGVRFRGDMEACYRANLWLRTANRILIPLSEFSCSTPEMLYDGVRSLNWAKYLTPEMTMAVDCSLRDSFTTHSGWVALKTKDAIVDDLRERLGRRPNVDPANPDLRVNVHLAKNRCTISLDSSGTPLDRRGYRIDRTEAPLRETLAAALVKLSGWDGSGPLIDPMCGSGTIVIEGALAAANRAPGLLRKFGFERWPGHRQGLWSELVKEAKVMIKERPVAALLGYDIDGKALEAARNNAGRAGVGSIVTFARGDIRNLQPPPQKGVLIFNPPYGERLGEIEKLKPFYKEIGDVMKKRCSGYTAYILTGNPELAKSVGLKPSRRIVLYNGPIECRLLKYELY